MAIADCSTSSTASCRPTLPLGRTRGRAAKAHVELSDEEIAVVEAVAGRSLPAAGQRAPVPTSGARPSAASRCLIPSHPPRARLVDARRVTPNKEDHHAEEERLARPLAGFVQHPA